MTTRIARHAHLLELVDLGIAVMGPARQSKAFHQNTIRQYPRVRDAIDWARVPGSTMLRLSEAGDDELIAFVRSTSLGRHSHVAVIYMPESEGLIAPINAALTYIDTFTRIVPRICYLVGAEPTGSGYDYAFADFLEWKFEMGLFLGGLRRSS
jgi:hypothetical protein